MNTFSVYAPKPYIFYDLRESPWSTHNTHRRTPPTHTHTLAYCQLLCPPTPIHCAGLRRYHQTNQSAQGEILCGCAGVRAHRATIWVRPVLGARAKGTTLLSNPAQGATLLGVAPSRFGLVFKFLYFYFLSPALPSAHPRYQPFV